MPNSKCFKMIPPSEATIMAKKILEMTRQEMDEAFGIGARLMGNENTKTGFIINHLIEQDRLRRWAKYSK